MEHRRCRYRSIESKESRVTKTYFFYIKRRFCKSGPFHLRTQLRHIKKSSERENFPIVEGTSRPQVKLNFQNKCGTLNITRGRSALNNERVRRRIGELSAKSSTELPTNIRESKLEERNGGKPAGGVKLASESF